MTEPAAFMYGFDSTWVDQCSSRGMFLRLSVVGATFSSASNVWSSRVGCFELCEFRRSEMCQGAGPAANRWEWADRSRPIRQLIMKPAQQPSRRRDTRQLLRPTPLVCMVWNMSPFSGTLGST